MLGSTDAVATLAVTDIDRARRFYEGKLGLAVMPSPEPAVLLLKSGNSKIIVYASEYSGTNKATAATWPVKDVEGTVKELKRKGVTFEHYDFPGVKMEGDVHVMGKSKAAWFKDPDGNILAIVSE
jgi:catechol 2,3-dioxygenase-like lactoylglutathione lyase family enzyme